MSMITEQVEYLIKLSNKHPYDSNISTLQRACKEAAKTIEALSAKVRAANMERSTAYYNGGWIPVSEGLPERAEGGASNWHTDTVMVCMYGNAQYDGYDDFGYEILTGIFEELEDEETKTKDLCFVPDRFTLFIPDEWDFFVLDKNYETHLPKNECMYLVDDYSDKSEFHDKYFKVLAWMPLPASYKSQERSDKE